MLAGYIAAVVVALVLPTGIHAAEPLTEPWQQLEPGLDFAEIVATPASRIGDSRVRVLRIDPARFGLRLLNASAPDQGSSRTAKEWSRQNDLVAAINASMFQTDMRTSVSLMRSRDHVNNPELSHDNAVLAFDALEEGLPPFRMIDRKCDDLDGLRPRYGSLVQNIRMVTCNRTNVWSQQPKRWSAATVAMDDSGRALFVHVRSPYTMHDLVNILLAMPLGIQRMMYVEGGPEAQLYIRSGTVEHEFVGSYETGFMGNDTNQDAWAVPNVIGVSRR